MKKNTLLFFISVFAVQGFAQIDYTVSELSTAYEEVFYNDQPNNHPDGYYVSEWDESTLIGLASGDVLFHDFNNDGFTDMILSGYTGRSLATRYYLNDGTGKFVLADLEMQVFPNAMESRLFLHDYDNDGDQDVFLYGSRHSLGWTALWFENDGEGNFVEDSDVNAVFTEVVNGNVDLADVNADGNIDIVFTGVFQGNMIGVRSEIYFGSADGSFIKSGPEAFLEGVHLNGACTANFIDADNDENVDFLILTGFDEMDVPSTFVYSNADGVFTKIDSDIVDVFKGDLNIGDVDGDGDNDFIISGVKYIYEEGTGEIIGEEELVCLYKYDNGAYTLDEKNEFKEVSFGESKFYDFDKDGDLDLLLTGSIKVHWSEPSTVPRAISYIYLNDGSGVFTKYENSPFKKAAYATIGIADIDGDTDDDILILGSDGWSNVYFTNLYINNEFENLAVNSFDKDNFNVYPNPTAGKVNIDLGEAKNVSVKLTNIAGQVVFSENNINAKEYFLDINSVSGLYFLEIISANNGKAVHKIIKN